MPGGFFRVPRARFDAVGHDDFLQLFERDPDCHGVGRRDDLGDDVRRDRHDDAGGYAAWANILVLILWTVATPILRCLAVALMLVPSAKSLRARRFWSASSDGRPDRLVDRASPAMILSRKMDFSNSLKTLSMANIARPAGVEESRPWV